MPLERPKKTRNKIHYMISLKKKIPGGKDENVMEIYAGNAYTAMWIFLIPLNYMLRIG